MIIGIDFSINSTAVTLKNDSGIVIYSFVPNYESGKRAFSTHDYFSDVITICSYEKESNTKDSIEDQRIKIRNAYNLATLIVDTLRPALEVCTRINIEGFSYASKGNSFIDLITYNTFLKAKLYEVVGDKIYVIPPKTLKKQYTGNGNATKCGMMRTYVEKNDNPITRKISALGLIKEGEFTIPKPLDDVIDSIALAELGSN